MTTEKCGSMFSVRELMTGLDSRRNFDSCIALTTKSCIKCNINSMHGTVKCNKIDYYSNGRQYQCRLWCCYCYSLFVCFVLFVSFIHFTKAPSLERNYYYNLTLDFVGMRLFWPMLLGMLCVCVCNRKASKAQNDTHNDHRDSLSLSEHRNQLL